MLEIHRGFFYAVGSVWDDIQKELALFEKPKDIFICGHSLGGALAQLAAHRLANAGHCIGGVYTFWSTKSRKIKNFSAHYKKIPRASKPFLMINNEDIVPQIPPKILGFSSCRCRKSSILVKIIRLFKKSKLEV